MTKKINRYSIEKYFKKLEIETERKTPKDIKEFINSKRFSESLGDVIKVGDMDLIHLIRTLKKENERSLFKMSLVLVLEFPVFKSLIIETYHTVPG